MKKLSYGLVALLLAVGAMAFTKPVATANQTNYSWFETDENGNVINPGSEPPSQSTDPFGCSGGLNGCSKAYDGAVLSGGVYIPSGTLRIVDTKD